MQEKEKNEAKKGWMWDGTENANERDGRKREMYHRFEWKYCLIFVFIFRICIPIVTTTRSKSHHVKQSDDFRNETVLFLFR